MAERMEMSQLLGWVAEQLGRKRGTLDHLARPWTEAFAKVPAATVRRVVEGMLDADPAHVPTLARVRAEVAKGAGGAKSASCGKCWSGLREVAIRAERRGVVDTVVYMAHCDCDAGTAARSARGTAAGLPPTVQELTDRARQADPRAVAYVDPTAEQRLTDAARKHLAAGQATAEQRARRAREAKARAERVRAKGYTAPTTEREEWAPLTPGMAQEPDLYQERMGYADGDDPGPEAWL